MGKFVVFECNRLDGSRHYARIHRASCGYAREPNHKTARAHGPLVGVLSVCGVDLILEPVAYYTGIWTWLQPYTSQTYFGSTIANALVWAGMCLIGIKLWDMRGRLED